MSIKNGDDWDVMGKGGMDDMVEGLCEGQLIAPPFRFLIDFKFRGLTFLSHCRIFTELHDALCLTVIVTGEQMSNCEAENGVASSWKTARREIS